MRITGIHLERALGQVLLIALGIFATTSARASDFTFLVYNLSLQEFQSNVESGKLGEARDSEEFRNFISLKYNLSSVSNEQLSGLATIDDFQAYRKEAILWTARTSGNPTCICD
jgi:hypothetical protein